MPAFIAEAQDKAVEHGVNHLCKFVLSDINQMVASDSVYDVVVFGAAGDVLGTPEETFDKLRRVVLPHGIIVLDDAYAKSVGEGLPTRNAYLNTLNRCGLRVVAERLADVEGIVALNRRNQACIEKRAAQLCVSRPEHVPLFTGYVQSQLEECQQLESALDCVTLLVTPVVP
jgi:ubiquinone/menaquinone biosynthesis C-methylase UbiE